MANRAELVKNAAKMSPDQAHDPSNPKVFFDVKIGGIKAGRITFEVFIPFLSSSFAPARALCYVHIFCSIS